MKEVDPEVAALLEDLPPVQLPPALIEAGWGQRSATDILQTRPDHQTTATPADQMAPVYDHTCVQCGRPITLSRHDQWVDHGMSTRCDKALVEGEPGWWTASHTTEADLIKYRTYLEREQARRDRLQQEIDAWDKANPIAAAARAATPVTDPAAPRGRKFKDLRKKTGPCGVNKHGHSCAHICAHDGGHFGFHECKFCRHLWR